MFLGALLPIVLAFLVLVASPIAALADASVPALWWHNSGDPPDTSPQGCATWITARKLDNPNDSILHSRAVADAAGYLGEIAVNAGMQINDDLLPLVTQIAMYVDDYCSKRPFDNVPMAVSTLVADMASRGQIAYPKPH
jgi:hypothetical protein